MSTNALPQILIIELGSQTTLLIERTLREEGYRSMIFELKRALKVLQKHRPKAIILSGGHASVYDENAPQIPKELFSLTRENGTPVHILGICYGMQRIANDFGGEVAASHADREYGPARIQLSSPDPLFARTAKDQVVWASHGDTVTKLPPGFRPIARSSSGGIAAMVSLSGNIHCVQFHPEVTHSKYGRKQLANFAALAGCEKNWRPENMSAAIREYIRTNTGDRKVVVGFSGGVDSTTLATEASTVLGKRLLAVVVDGGQLRENEMSEIRLHAQHAGVRLKIVKARRQFAKAMMGITDAEKKRARFKKLYERILTREAKRFGGKTTIILQGTLAPDLIESGATGGAKIKSHHNVGLRFGGLTQLHPFGHLFKYEVRALARELGLPKSVWNRQPFPGPGDFIRIIGTPATPKRLAIVKWAYARTAEVAQRYGVFDSFSQLIVAYIGVKTVGVKGDTRVYGGSIVVRAVRTADFMTVDGVHLSTKVEDEIARVLMQHRDIIRVWFDPTDKPPATTEME